MRDLGGQLVGDLHAEFTQQQGGNLGDGGLGLLGDAVDAVGHINPAQQRHEIGLAADGRRMHPAQRLREGHHGVLGGRFGARAQHGGE